MSNELATIENFGALYPILQADSNATRCLALNLGGERLEEWDLTKVTVPTGGGTLWLYEDVGGASSVAELSGIILFRRNERQYYRTKNPSNNPPDCQSSDMVNGVGNPGGQCEGCPFNIREDERDSDDMTTCKPFCKVYLLQPGEGVPVVVKVPRSSLKSLRLYMSKLKVAYYDAVTSLTLERVTSKAGIAYARINFRLKGVVDEPYRPGVQALISCSVFAATAGL